MDNFINQDIDDIFEIDSNSRASNSIIDIFNYVNENLREIPAKELRKRGMISDTTIASLVAFYSANHDTTSLFRKTKNVESPIGDAWAGIVKSKAIEHLFKNSPPRYEGITANFISDLVRMSSEINLISEVKSKLHSVGIILIFEPAIDRSKVDGVTGKLPNGTPYIGMSLRMHRLDNFWFTLLHELGHVDLHYDKLDVPIIDSDDGQNDIEIELEADQYALNSFIKRRIWHTTPIKNGAATTGEVVEFAHKQGIHPAIVAGRIRKETNNYRIYSRLVTRFNVREIIWGKA